MPESKRIRRKRRMSNAEIIKGFKVTGTLQMESPLLIGSGENDNVIDIQVLKTKEGTAFIPGTSFAGVLRDFAIGKDEKIAEALFGKITREKAKNNTAERSAIEKLLENVQSAIRINDVMLENAEVIVRDGVKINEFTGIAENGAKYDYEVVERGAKGEFSFTVEIRKCHEGLLEEMKQMLKDFADYIATGIRLGALTAKGFGQAKGEHVRVMAYDFTKKKDVKAWVMRESGEIIHEGKVKDVKNKEDLTIAATFALKSSLLIKRLCNEVAGDKDINARQMKSKDEYLIPGTSIKGVLRKQAYRILRKLDKDVCIVDRLMGFSTEKEKQKSRFIVDEVYFKNGVKEAAQSRIRIDRFTGAVMNGMLLTDVPIWQEHKGEPVITMNFTIKRCQPWEAGLILFLLKDLWTGNLAIGGDKGIGRGLLQGIEAKIEYDGDFTIKETDKFTVEGDKAKLEGYAKALQEVGCL